MVSFGRFVFKATGIMSNKGLSKNSKKIGEAIASQMKKNGGEISIENVHQIISDTVGKKAADKITISNSKEAARDFFLKQDIASENDLNHVFEAAIGFLIPAKYKRQGFVFVNKDKALGGVAANALTHEIQHALSLTSGRRGLYLLKGKFSLGRRFIDKEISKMKDFGVQDKYVKMQEYCVALLNSGGQVNNAIVRDMLYSKGILKKGETKKNLFILKQLKKAYKDEVRSWTVGLEAHEKFEGSKVINSDLYLNIFKSLMNGVSQEAKQLKIDRFKKFLAIKPAEKKIQ